jgi:UDP-GlcNAc:undecaprenyl-phosphate GlcNAc-1-phosphate transferase
MAPVRDRDVHDEPTPRLGGLAMAGGLLAGLLLASKLPKMRSVFDESNTAIALLSGVAVIVALGMIDDKWGLDAPTKLAGQVLAAGVMAFQGIAVIWLPIGGTFVLDPITSVLFTVIIVLVSINAINFVDGLDGLAAGIVAVAAGAFFAYSYLLSVELGFERAALATLVSVLLVGVCLGFLPSNFFPARIFMGDTGSMMLGLLLAAATITLSGQVDPSAMAGGTLLPALLPVLLPVAVMAVPLVDLGLAVIRRTRAGRNPFAPDKQHLHHRLLEMGHSQVRAVLLMYAWTGLVAGTAVAVAFVPLVYAVIGFLVGLSLLLVGVRRPGKQSGGEVRRLRTGTGG